MAVRGGGLIGKELCEALGLDSSKVTRLVIDIPAGDVMTVEVTMFPDKVSAETMNSIFGLYINALDAPTITKRYQLVDMTPPEGQ